MPVSGMGVSRFDVVGHSSRPDVFELNVNETPMRPVVAKTDE